MINNKHQSLKSVFSRQPHTAIEQLLPTSGIVLTDKRTDGWHTARQTRITPLDVGTAISRSSSRLTADQAGEWPDLPTQTRPRATGNIRNRPDSAPTHIRLSEPNEAGVTHQRQVVTLIHLDSTRNTGSRTNITRPETASKTYTSGNPGRGGGALPIDPDNSRNAFMHPERPRGGVRQDKGVLTNALSASQEPAPLEKGGRAHFVNKDSPRSQNAPRIHSLSNARVKLVHTTFWLHPLVRAELERIAQCESLTLSQVGATGLDQWVRGRLHAQHEAVLYPVLRQLVRDELRAFGNRIIFFLMRIAFAAEQSRILITNVLHKLTIQMGLPIDNFNKLVDSSNKMARRNIIAHSPEIKRLCEEWEASRGDEKEDDKTNSNGKEKKNTNGSC
jgi:hypothetical protein